MADERGKYYLVHNAWTSLVYEVHKAEIVNGLIEMDGLYHAKAQDFPMESKLIFLERKFEEFNYYETLEEAYESHSNKR